MPFIVTSWMSTFCIVCHSVPRVDRAGPSVRRLPLTTGGNCPTHGECIYLDHNELANAVAPDSAAPCMQAARVLPLHSAQQLQSKLCGDIARWLRALALCMKRLGLRYGHSH
ncbi:hypothetical protein FA95DRAFT_1128926 [Auriscalpium vulgare]|uniref:Uncharacterized protein n=1 Tax=Auriscalpium vulgare TaxID=40419 RepID=A0ACB8RVQ6_9AGAM|nr:hypothetical protein FA95DRAFT_1128926 [Auriscalpium vulgare]